MTFSSSAKARNTLSAGGQLLQPWLVNNSSTTSPLADSSAATSIADAGDTLVSPDSVVDAMSGLGSSMDSNQTGRASKGRDRYFMVVEFSR